MIIGKPDSTEYGEFYAGYISKVDSDNIIEFLAEQLTEFRAALDQLDDEQASVVHAPYHWTLKQLLGHLIDGEKVFGYRLHRMACGDLTPMAGFEHEPYVANLDYESVTLDALIDEFDHLRQANLLFLRRLPEASQSRTGRASDTDFTVRSQAFIIGGHVQHHLEIIRQRLANLQ